MMPITKREAEKQLLVVEKKIDDLLSAAENEKRRFTDEENATFSALESRADELIIAAGKADVVTLESYKNRLDDIFMSAKVPPRPPRQTAADLGLNLHPIEGWVEKCAAAARANTSIGTGSGLAFRNQQTGELIRALTGDDKFHHDEPMDFGNVVYSILTGNRDRLSERESLAITAGNDSRGGYLVDTGLSNQISDVARSKMVCADAGCQFLPMSHGEVAIARVASDATSHWRPETGTVAASEPTFEKVTLRAKTLAAIVPVSIELLEDSDNAGQIIADTLTASMGQTLDEAALAGTGASSEPLGVESHSGVNAIGSVGTPTTYGNATAAIGDIMAANYNGDVSGLSWIQPVATAELYDGLANTTGQPLQPTPWASKVKRFATNAMTTGTDIMGDFSQMVIGLRTGGVVIRVLDSGSVTDGNSDTWNATSQLMRHIVAYMRADVVLLRPSWFTVSTGITLS